MRMLLLCSIGPVQPLIASARTVRDLAFGSWLLSELAKSAASVLHDQGNNLIFPAPQDIQQDLQPDSDLNVSNRVVVVVDGEPEAMAETAHQAVLKRLEDMFQRYVAEKNCLSEDLLERSRWQIQDMLEFYWVAVPYPESAAYDKVRESAVWALDLRKNTRDFASWPGLAGVPKSALDGFREAVIVVRGPSNTNSRKIQRYTKEQKVQVIDEALPRLREGEVLSGVDLFKRLGGYNFPVKRSHLYEGIPSTSDVAARPLIKGINESKAEQWRTTIIQTLTNYTSEERARSETLGVYFFPDRASDLISDDDKYEKQRQFRQDFEAQWRHFFGEDTPYPHPYYALLVADGDGMGALIDAQIDAQKDEQRHRQLSQALAAFALKARQMIFNYEGYPIYTGGDDILALFPLHIVLEALEELDETFQDHMQAFLHPDTGGPPTLSGGLVIAHHLTPLEDVLQRAREAERQAKDRDGKHGLTVALLRRSGEAVRVRDGWPQLVENLPFWVALAQHKAFPRGLPYELRQLAEFLQPTELDIRGYRSEVARIFKQKREADIKEALDRIEQHIEGRFEGSKIKASEVLAHIAYEMVTAMDLARAREQANLEPYPLAQEANV
jgi:CRISPR-associated protein Cmr2